MCSDRCRVYARSPRVVFLNKAVMALVSWGTEGPIMDTLNASQPKPPHAMQELEQYIPPSEKVRRRREKLRQAKREPRESRTVSFLGLGDIELAEDEGEESKGEGQRTSFDEYSSNSLGVVTGGLPYAPGPKEIGQATGFVPEAAVEGASLPLCRVVIDSITVVAPLHSKAVARLGVVLGRVVVQNVDDPQDRRQHPLSFSPESPFLSMMKGHFRLKQEEGHFVSANYDFVQPQGSSFLPKQLFFARDRNIQTSMIKPPRADGEAVKFDASEYKPKLQQLWIEVEEMQIVSLWAGVAKSSALRSPIGAGSGAGPLPSSSEGRRSSGAKSMTEALRHLPIASDVLLYSPLWRLAVGLPGSSPQSNKDLLHVDIALSPITLGISQRQYAMLLGLTGGNLAETSPWPFQYLDNSPSAAAAHEAPAQNTAAQQPPQTTGNEAAKPSERVVETRRKAPSENMRVTLSLQSVEVFLLQGVHGFSRIEIIEKALSQSRRTEDSMMRFLEESLRHMTRGGQERAAAAESALAVPYVAHLLTSDERCRVHTDHWGLATGALAQAARDQAERRAFRFVPVAQLAAACVEELTVAVSMQDDGSMGVVARIGRFYVDDRRPSELTSSSNTPLYSTSVYKPKLMQARYHPTYRRLLSLGPCPSDDLEASSAWFIEHGGEREASDRTSSLTDPVIVSVFMGPIDSEQVKKSQVSPLRARQVRPIRILACCSA